MTSEVSDSESESVENSASSNDEVNSKDEETGDTGTRTTVSENQWVIVGYLGKRKNTQLKYLGQITKVYKDTDNVDITFVKKLSETTEPIFTYPNNEETDTVLVFYILQHVSKPHINNRHHLEFSDIKHTIVRRAFVSRLLFFSPFALFHDLNF